VKNTPLTGNVRSAKLGMKKLTRNDSTSTVVADEKEKKEEPAFDEGLKKIEDNLNKKAISSQE